MESIQYCVKMTQSVLELYIVFGNTQIDGKRSILHQSITLFPYKNSLHVVLYIGTFKVKCIVQKFRDASKNWCRFVGFEVF